MRRSALWLAAGMGLVLLASASNGVSAGDQRDAAAGEGAWIGVAVRPLSDDMRAAWDYQGAGLMVTGVEPGGPASHAGIQLGDLLVVVGSVSLRVEEDLIKARNRIDPGQQVSVVVARNEGRFIKIVNLEPFDVGVAPEPVGSETQPSSEPAMEGATEVSEVVMPVQAAIVRDPVIELGVQGVDLNAGLASALSVPMSSGVLVLQVTSGSPADRVGIRPGDVITRVGDTSIEDVPNLGKALEGSSSMVSVRLQRQKTAREVQVPLESPPAPGMRDMAAGVALEKKPVALEKKAANPELEGLRQEIEKLRAELEAQKSQ